MYKLFFQCCLALISISGFCQHSFQLAPLGKISICHGSSTLLQAPVGAVAYNWEKNGVVLKEEPFRTSGIKVSASGVYMVRYTDPASGQVFVSSPVEVAFYPAPMYPTIWAPRTHLSGGEELYLTAPPGFTYQWYFNNQPVKGNQSLLVAQEGKYQLRITDENGCVSPLSKAVVIQAVHITDNALATRASK